LGELVDLASGGTPARSRPDYYEGTIPWITGADIDAAGTVVSRALITEEAVSKSATTVAEPGWLLLVTRTSVGKVGLADKATAFSQDITGIKPHPDQIDTRYLMHFLRASERHFQDHARGATIKGITRAVVEGLHVPLPPLDEQRRIAAILDKAEWVHGKRNQVLTHLADLRASIFSDMFGDPVVSSGGTALAEMADIQIGPFGSLLHKEDYVTGGVPLINPSHILNGEIRPDPDFSVPADKAATLKNYQLRAGDVVMGRRGEMGRCAVVEVEHDGYLCGTGSLIVRPRPDLAESTYLQAALSNASTKSLLERLALGSTLPNLNATIVSGLPIRRPPLTEQKKFRATLERLGMQDQLVQRAINADDDLFRSLQYRAFIGQL
jgi:type I restriction enzyme S subunit